MNIKREYLTIHPSPTRTHLYIRIGMSNLNVSYEQTKHRQHTNIPGLVEGDLRPVRAWAAERPWATRGH